MKGMFTTLPFTIHLRGSFRVGARKELVYFRESDQYSGSELMYQVQNTLLYQLSTSQYHLYRKYSRFKLIINLQVQVQTSGEQVQDLLNLHKKIST